MASTARQFGSRVANPQTVLKHIGSQPVDLSTGTAQPAQQRTTDTIQSSARLKIFQPQTETADAQQTRQLGRHLIQWRAQLEAAQADFDQQKHHWHCQNEAQQENIDRQQQTLQQRERQVRSLETQLLQLQNDVIDGQTALRAIAETISRDGFLHVIDQEKIAALEDLRFEISERFDYLIERWTRFHFIVGILHNSEPIC